MSTIHPDVSVFQNHIDSSFNRDFVMFRISNEHGHIDDKIKVNLERAIEFRRSGKIVNLGGYIDPGVVENSVHLHNIDVVGFPKDAVVMIDAESWPQNPDGSDPLVSGDHSGQFNQLADAVRSRQNGRADLVWGYGNKGDLERLWPNRRPWLGFIVASYGTAKPSFLPEMVGWQYTDGQPRDGDAPDHPLSTPPFGNCDYNELFISIPNQEEDDVTTKAEVQGMLDNAVQQIHHDLQILLHGGVPDSTGQVTVTHPKNLDALFNEVQAIKHKLQA